MKIMVLFLAILLNLFIPIVMILVLLRKQQLRKKFIFFGFLQYGIGKVLLTLLNLFCRNVNMPNLLADTGVQVLLLAILAVGTKYILYIILHQKPMHYLPDLERQLWKYSYIFCQLLLIILCIKL